MEEVQSRVERLISLWPEQRQSGRRRGVKSETYTEADYLAISVAREKGCTWEQIAEVIWPDRNPLRTRAEASSLFQRLQRRYDEDEPV